MIFGWARPEDAIVLFDFLPGYAVVIGVAATRSHTQLFEDFAWRVEIKILPTTHAPRDLLHDPPVHARFTGRIVCFVNLHDAALAVAGYAFVFTPGRTRQDHVGVARPFRHEEVDADVEFQTFQGTANIIRIWKTHHYVVTDRKQASNFTFAHLREHLNN